MNYFKKECGEQTKTNVEGRTFNVSYLILPKYFGVILACIIQLFAESYLK